MRGLEPLRTFSAIRLVQLQSHFPPIFGNLSFDYFSFYKKPRGLLALIVSEAYFNFCAEEHF